jgi:hypothetical protein
MFGSIQGLHAQATPPVYYVAEIDVTNPDAYAKEYAPKAQAIIKSMGGRQLAIGGKTGDCCGWRGELCGRLGDEVDQAAW